MAAEPILWMQRAYQLAQRAAAMGEVPVGAVVVKDGYILAEGANASIAHCDPTAHAEILALRAAGCHLNNYRLLGCSVFVSLEPCAMCVGAMLHARISHLYYGAAEPRAGAVSSHLHLLDQPIFNHRIEYHGGLLADQCGQLLKDFFRQRRA